MNEERLMQGIEESKLNGYKQVAFWEHDDSLRTAEGFLILQGYCSFNKKVSWIDADGKPIYMITVNLT